MGTTDQRKLYAFAIASVFAFVALGLSAVQRTAAKVSQNGFKAYGSSAKLAHQLKPFTSIDAGGVFEVYVKFGSEPSIEFEAPKDILPHLTSDVRNGTLVLSVDTDSLTIHDGKIKAYVVATHLKGVTLSGASTMVINGKVLEPSFEAHTSGASNLTFSATVQNLTLEAEGSAKVSIGALTAKKVALDASGAANCTITGTVDTCSIEASGSSSIGGPSFSINKVTIQTSGASSADFHVVTALNAEASGASNIRYTGNPQLTRSTSGAANIEKGG